MSTHRCADRRLSRGEDSPGSLFPCFRRGVQVPLQVPAAHAEQPLRQRRLGVRRRRGLDSGSRRGDRFNRCVSRLPVRGRNPFMVAPLRGFLLCVYASDVLVYWETMIRFMARVTSKLCQKLEKRRATKIVPLGKCTMLISL